MHAPVRLDDWIPTIQKQNKREREREESCIRFDRQARLFSLVFNKLWMINYKEKHGKT
jgi:hypothetical protein